MPINLDFTTIREYDSSKEKGFEELVCQIAHIEKPEKGKSFVRKEGSGGDAGVECFWILDDGQEYAWQAKYFIDALTPSQWSQIDESVKTAIDKHKNLTRYYVCIPRDRTDSRKRKNGKSVKSALDYWNEHVEKWTRLAASKNMHVQFEYWGKHELVSYLQQDNPPYTGKILYWFNTAALSCDSLRQLALKSRECLGERYTPENNIELPISKLFSCIGSDDDWKNSIKVILSDAKHLLQNIKSVKHFPLLSDKKDLCIHTEKKYQEFLHMAFDFKNNDSVLFANNETCKSILNKIIALYRQLANHLYDNYLLNKEAKNEYSSDRGDIQIIISKLHSLLEFFTSKEIEAGKKKELLVTGAAGSGKSHLLCDISLKRLNHRYPTVFLLGQHYSGGDPIRFIAEKLNLQQFPNTEVLGALDALGESHKCKTLIIIDAINEGKARKDWSNYLNAFLQDCKIFNYLAVVISCRTTYVDFIISKDVLKTIPQITHEGFKGYEHRAAQKYFSNQEISLPNLPFFSSEFSNPLFLKIFCRAMKEMHLHEFPKGLTGFNKVFEFYINGLEAVIKNKKQTHNDCLVHKAIKAFIPKLYPDNLWGAPYDEAEKIINSFDTNKSDSTTLLDLLIFEGLMSTDLIENDDGEKSEVVRFTYERFSDYALANYILANYSCETDFSKSFLEGGAIFNLLKRENRYSTEGIIEALGIEIPEKFGKEFIEYVQFDDDNNKYLYDWLLETTFRNSVLSRTANSISDKSLELLNRLQDYPYHDSRLDILISLSTELNHPWNADFLAKDLQKMTLPERDLFWSTHVAVNDYDEDENQAESPIRTLLNWVLDSDISLVNEERLRLTAITLLWLTTTSNRNVRQQATKAFSKVLYFIPKQIQTFLIQYNDIDDPYLVTSLYGAAYGAVINIQDKELIREISDVVIEKQFKTEVMNPNILTRDYARGIIEYANLFKGIIDNIEKYRPPFKSKWPLENPLPSEIDEIAPDDSKIKYSTQIDFNDFAKYVMTDVEYWTNTPLSEKVPKSEKELQYEFANTLPENLKLKYIQNLDQKVKNAENIKNIFDLETFFENDITDETAHKTTIDEDVLVSDNSVYDSGNEDLDFLPPIIEKDEKELISEIISNLGESSQEYFKWIYQMGVSDSPAEFNQAWACRWVIKRAYTLGWTKELFDDFESMFYRSYYDLDKNVVERIGKKYQWIAFYELLERLADNLIFKDRGYSDVDDSKFYGPWQIGIREMDPSCWSRPQSEINYSDSALRWWRPYQFNLNLDELDEQKKWLQDENDLPDLKSLLCVNNSETKEDWLVLHSLCDWKSQPIKEISETAETNIWYRINTCIIKKENLPALKLALLHQNLCSPHIIYVPDNDNQRFLGEYPWHPCYNFLREWIDLDDWNDLKIPCEYHVPLFEYNWSTNSSSNMPDESTTFFMPSKKIINELKLHKKIANPSYWYQDDKLVFMDPSLETDTQPCAIINKEIFCKWINDNNYTLVWLIGGEKQLFDYDLDKFFGRQIYSGLYSIGDDGNITGESWSKYQPPNR